MGGFLNGGKTVKFLKFEFSKLCFLRFWGIFEPGFGFLWLFWVNSAHSQPQGTLGGDFWAKTKFRKIQDFRIF